jgi:hypothetical protein
MRVTHIGTLNWVVLDDTGTRRVLEIPNSILVPQSKIRLLSPQHLAQEMDRNKIVPHGTLCTTYSDRIELIWNNRTCTKTVQFNSSNIGVIYTAPRYAKYEKYCSETDKMYNKPTRKTSYINKLVAYASLNGEVIETMVPSQREPLVQNQREQTSETMVSNQGKPLVQDQREQPLPFNLNGDDTKNYEPEAQVDEGNTPEMELLKYHQVLSHIPMS